ncbi:MAG: hypothetical protein IJH64_00165 [Oscillospiraceae bacterium]|nr:hypothetical protein [Oscillospiraceae bacterium]
MTRKEIIDYLIAFKKCDQCEETVVRLCKDCDNHMKGSSPKCYDAIDEAIKLLESGGLKTVQVINKYGEAIGEFYFDPSRQVLFNGCIAVEALKADGFTILPS